MHAEIATAAAPNSTTGQEIILRHPFTSAAGVRIERLQVRRARRADLRAAAKFSRDEADQEDFLFAQITGLTLEDIGQLDLADSRQLADTFRLMLEH